ncbi:MAG: NAD-dependent epimerase/dehydratase family protein [Pseudomonadota bacterium]
MSTGTNSTLPPVIVTGAAGFIGAHLCSRLLARGYRVHGVDNFCDYYPPTFKRARVAALCANERFELHEHGLRDQARLEALFSAVQPATVFHLAAQAGVRYSIEQPHVYTDSNLAGFINILECCRHFGRPHLVFASSSSVYGASAQAPFRERDAVDHPVSLYAATKRANELLAHSYAHLYGIRMTGLRFFTVYGPWGRPDMAPMLFARAILEGRKITVFNEGRMQRDFTEIEDIVDGILGAATQPPAKARDTTRPDHSTAPYRLYNLGRGEPVPLMHFIETLERHLGRPARIAFRPMQPGDMVETWSDTTMAREAIGFAPRVSLDAGIQRFVQWLQTEELDLNRILPQA